MGSTQSNLVAQERAAADEVSAQYFERVINRQAIPAAGFREHPGTDLATQNGVRQVNERPIDLQYVIDSQKVRARNRQNQDWVRAQEMAVHHQRQ